MWIEIADLESDDQSAYVTSLAEVWIEIPAIITAKICCNIVTSLAEVWIEIFVKSAWGWEYESLPLRKCGLKFPTAPRSAP